MRRIRGLGLEQKLEQELEQKLKLTHELNIHFILLI